MLPDVPSDAPRRFDYWIVGLFALLLFGYAAFSGRPLTMHEARLPETSREMLATHHWLLPTSGPRPWLERPPLPHWVVATAMAITGRVDQVWVVRLPSAAMGAATVLLTMWIAGQCFGRTVGMLSGLALATSFEFYVYACSAEDDVYLAALVAAAMALFVRGERAGAGSSWRPLGSRPWHAWMLFAVAGASNLARGPLLGPAYIGSAIGAYLLWDGLARRRWAGLARVAWLWGMLLAIVLTVAWPAWAVHRVPDVAANWSYDYLGRLNGAYSSETQPWWYYAPTLAAAAAPWTPLCLIGLAATAGAALRRGTSSARLVWCWAVVPVLGLSIPHGKHHHYLVPVMAAWAILAGVGMREAGRFLLAPRGPAWLRNPWLAVAAVGVPGAVAILVEHGRFPSPVGVTLGLAIVWVAVVGLTVLALRRASGPLLAGTLVGGISLCCCYAQTYLAAATDHTVADTAFLLRTRGAVPPAAPLYVDAKLGPVGNLDFFRCQFYARPDTGLLHNLSYLRDRTITAPTVYVIARGPAESQLAQLGAVEVVDRSTDSHESVGPPPARVRYGNLTLFRLRFDPGLKRYPAPQRITSLQAMERAESTDPGPWCGPRL
jgi:4-amino-4-deoxy-L-arabinose transferase-like glycosyltransferase